MNMHALMKFLHIAAAVSWLGGVSFMLYAFRPAAAEQFEAPERLQLIARVLNRFFVLVWLAIAVLLVSGLAMLLSVGMRNAPLGWHLMFGIGMVMFLLFGHLYFGPFRRLGLAISANDWPEGGRRAGQLATLAGVTLLLGAIAIAAVVFLA